MKASTVLSILNAALSAAAITHPGLLHTEDDFDRIKNFVSAKQEPQLTGWNKLVAHADAAHEPAAKETVCRGSDCESENYPSLYKDVAAAYINAVYWKVTGNEENADAAAAILDAWSSTLKTIEGGSDSFLAAGIYGYQMANAAEILRTYEKWSGLEDVAALLQDVFLPMNEDFLTRHNDAEIDHYWANWDLCNLASIHAIGVVSDNQTAIDRAITYFKEGEGNGALEKAIWKIHTEEDTGKALGQGQEAGRDQGHSLLDFGLLGVLAQQAYNQGEDLFASGDNLILAGAEYVFKYNTGNEVPYTEYTNSDETQSVISEASRGELRPIAELLYAHYNGVKNLDASWTKAYRDLVVEDGEGAEGGSGDFGTTSGGYDVFGFGTALYRLEE